MQLTLASKAVLAALLLASLGGKDAAAQDTGQGDPLPELQGTWYATREKVTIEVKGNVISVVENTSAKSWPNEQQLQPGLVLAQLGPVEHQPGSRVVWSGECWTNLTHGNCPEAASAYYEKRGTPHWNLYIHAMSFVRKAQLAEWESSRE